MIDTFAQFHQDCTDRIAEATMIPEHMLLKEVGVGPIGLDQSARMADEFAKAQSLRKP